MANLQLTYTVNIQVSREEFRIIGLALSGKIKTADDTNAARQLNEKLLQLAHIDAANIQKVYQNAMDVAAKDSNHAPNLADQSR